MLVLEGLQRDQVLGAELEYDVLVPRLARLLDDGTSQSQLQADLDRCKPLTLRGRQCLELRGNCFLRLIVAEAADPKNSLCGSRPFIKPKIYCFPFTLTAQCSPT